MDYQRKQHQLTKSDMMREKLINLEGRITRFERWVFDKMSVVATSTVSDSAMEGKEKLVAREQNRMARLLRESRND